MAWALPCPDRISGIGGIAPIVEMDQFSTIFPLVVAGLGMTLRKLIFWARLQLKPASRHNCHDALPLIHGMMEQGVKG
jgi:hypothetical protein